MFNNLDLRSIRILQIATVILGFGFLVAKYVLKYKYDFLQADLNLYEGLFRTFLGLSFFIGLQRLVLERKDTKNKTAFKILGWIFLVSGIISLLDYFV